MDLLNPKVGETVQTTARIVRIRFQSQDGTFCIVDAVTRKRNQFTMVGPLATFKMDDEVRVRGTWVDSKYGVQLRVETCEIALPSTTEGIARFLSSQINGIGPKLAERIVDAFGNNTITTLDHSPDDLLKVKGISPKRLTAIKEEWEKKQSTRQIFVFLQGHGLSYELSAKLLALYGNKTIPILQQQPYLLAKEVNGIGFRRADAIAKNMGFPTDSPTRIEAGIDYVLYDAESNDGHCCLPLQKLIDAATNLLQIPRDNILPYIDDLVSRRTIRTEIDDTGEMLVYRAYMWNLENAVAQEIARIAKNSGPAVTDEKVMIRRCEAELGIELAPTQRLAVSLGLGEKLMVITGGPGTGKTTLIKVFVAAAEKSDRPVFLAAPTGRAAKRLAETTACDAKTIHRLLEYAYQDDTRGNFTKSKDNPLPNGVYIIDEASMIDLALMRALLTAMPDEAQIIFVGDVDQLPSVGSGTVLKDLIASGCLPIVRLDTVFRQAEQSLIVKNAHRINNGNYPEIPSKEDMAAANCEFFLIQTTTPDHAENLIQQLVCEKIPQRFNLDPQNDIQVLCPMRQNAGGVERLNRILQNKLNPNGQPIPHKSLTFRVGDRVMQLKNDYDRDVYNGDIGTIITHAGNKTTIDFDGRLVEYASQHLENLQHAYACTVHKAQGSEYPAVICVFLRSQSFMLQRNLVYTALTRAKKLAIFITDPNTLSHAIRNNRPAERFTQLSKRITLALSASQD